MDRVLDAQADAFARLLALSPHDPDAAFRKAAELANGLFPHQIEGVAFLLGRTRAILADDMGLGKTRQAIVALRHIAPGGPYLVVSPASVKRNWAREIAIADPRATTHVVEKGTALEGRFDWVIVNYDILLKHVDALEKPAWAGIVFDEAHHLTAVHVSEQVHVGLVREERQADPAEWRDDDRCGQTPGPQRADVSISSDHRQRTASLF